MKQYRTVACVIIMAIAAIAGFFIGATLDETMGGSILFSMIAGIACIVYSIENRKIKAVIKVIGFVVFSSYLVSLKEKVAYLLIGIFSLVYLLYQFYLSGLETK